MIEFYPRDIPILSTCSRCPRGLLVNSPVFSGSGPWFARRCSTVLPHWRPTSSTLGPGGKNHRITNKKWGSRGVKFMDVSDFWALKNNGVPHSVHWSIMSIIIVVISWWPGGVPNFHTQMVPVFQILDGCNMIFRTPAKHGGVEASTQHCWHTSDSHPQRWRSPSPVSKRLWPRLPVPEFPHIQTFQGGELVAGHHQRPETLGSAGSQCPRRPTAPHGTGEPRPAEAMDSLGIPSPSTTWVGSPAVRGWLSDGATGAFSNTQPVFTTDPMYPQRYWSHLESGHCWWYLQTHTLLVKRPSVFWMFPCSFEGFLWAVHSCYSVSYPAVIVKNPISNLTLYLSQYAPPCWQSWQSRIPISRSTSIQRSTRRTRESPSKQQGSLSTLAWSLSVHQNLQNPSFSMPITIQNLAFLAFLRENQYKKSSPSNQTWHANLDVLLPPNHRLPAAATLPAQDDLQSPGRFHPKHSSITIIILSVGESNVYIIVYLSIIILYVYI